MSKFVFDQQGCRALTFAFALAIGFLVTPRALRSLRSWRSEEEHNDISVKSMHIDDR